MVVGIPGTRGASVTGGCVLGCGAYLLLGCQAVWGSFTHWAVALCDMAGGDPAIEVWNTDLCERCMRFIT